MNLNTEKNHEEVQQRYQRRMNRSTKSELKSGLLGGSSHHSEESKSVSAENLASTANGNTKYSCA